MITAYTTLMLKLNSTSDLRDLLNTEYEKYDEVTDPNERRIVASNIAMIEDVLQDRRTMNIVDANVEERYEAFWERHGG